MDHTASVSDKVTVIPIQHSHPDDAWRSVYELRCEMARMDERLLALEEWRYRCRQLDDELCGAAERRGGFVDGSGRSYRVAKRVPLADPDLSDRRG